MKLSGKKKLPSLSKLTLPRHSPPSRAGLVLKLLRRIAGRTRQSYALRFYSIRSVAARFHVSPTIISRHYQHLQSEGLLTMIWGSKTMVPARAAPARKGIYVIPVSVTELVGSESYRNYVLSLHRQLRSR